MPATHRSLDYPQFTLVAALFFLFASSGIAAVGGTAGRCDLGVAHGGAVYNFSLASPLPGYPHGVLSEDGYYKISLNDTVLWFQLCDQMLFNYDRPMCLGCEGCGGPTRCGMKCNALVSNNFDGYDVCTTIGGASNTIISLIDGSNPKKGVKAKMVSAGQKEVCSLSVSILCDPTLVQVAKTFDHSGICDYATTLRHPAGCARITSNGGNRWRWLGTLFTLIISLLACYFVVGTSYRFSFLGIRDAEAIPNLEFWMELPRRTMGAFDLLKSQLRGHTGGSRASYTRLSQ